MSFLTSLIQPFQSFLSDDPNVAMTQAGLLAVVVVVLFLLFYTLRDIVLRTRSFTYQCLCILLVALLPIVGFLLYILIRPARTVKEREIQEMLFRLTADLPHYTEDEEEEEEDDDEDDHQKNKHGHSKRHS